MSIDLRRHRGFEFIEDHLHEIACSEHRVAGGGSFGLASLLCNLRLKRSNSGRRRPCNHLRSRFLGAVSSAQSRIDKELMMRIQQERECIPAFLVNYIAVNTEDLSIADGQQ